MSGRVDAAIKFGAIAETEGRGCEERELRKGLEMLVQAVNGAEIHAALNGILRWAAMERDADGEDVQVHSAYSHGYGTIRTYVDDMLDVELVIKDMEIL